MDRQHRDLGWRAVRGVWLEGAIDSVEVREFLQQPADGSLLAKAYEDSVGRTDQTADRFREDADQVAKLEQTRAAIDGARQEVVTCGEELNGARATLSRAQTEWEELWRPFQVKAEAPRQMTAWLQRR